MYVCMYVCTLVCTCMSIHNGLMIIHVVYVPHCTCALSNEENTLRSFITELFRLLAGEGVFKLHTCEHVPSIGGTCMLDQQAIKPTLK